MGVGLVLESIDLIRKFTDMPSAGAKYTDADILELMGVAFEVILADLNTIDDHPVVGRMNLSIVPATVIYRLPPQVGEVFRVAKLSTVTNLPEYEIWPSSHFDFGGSGFILEGEVLRLPKDWNETVTLQLMFTPSGETYPHRSSITYTGDGTTLVLDTTPDYGTYDTRDNAFVGYLCRIISSGAGGVQQRVIVSQSSNTVTLDQAFSPTPTGTTVYEVVPAYGNLLKHVVCLRAAINIAHNENMGKKAQALERQLLSLQRALRLRISKKQARFPHYALGDTPDNLNRLGDVAYILW